MMEVARRPGYEEALELFGVKPEQYLQLARRTADHLHWATVALHNNAAIFQTTATEQSAGDIITITITENKAILGSQPVNELYWDETQSSKNAELFKVVISKIITAHEKADRNLHPMHREKWGALVPSKSYLITPVIVYINVVVFIAMVFAGLSPLTPTAKSLFEWGGNLRPAVINGEWWRLITYMFLHSGAIHLLMNTFALLYIGMFLEPLMGRFRFASAYVLTGVCAGLMSIVMHPVSVGVGASGAIFGMYGVFMSVLTTTHIQKTMRKTMLRSILFFVVFNLMYGLQGNIDNAAHIGGLVSGFALGYAYYYSIARKAPIGKQIITTAALTAVVILLVVLTASQLKMPL